MTAPKAPRSKPAPAPAKPGRSATPPGTKPKTQRGLPPKRRSY